MDIRDRRGLKELAARHLAEAPQAKRIILIWAGASALVALLVSLISFLLDTQIESTGGLSGIGLRSVLETVQSLLSLANVVLAPFWTLGYTACALRFARKQEAQPRNLLEGFRRFGPALRLLVLRYFLYLGLVIGALYLGFTVFSMTPLYLPVYELTGTAETALLEGTVTDALAMEMLRAMVPMFIGCGILCLAILIPVSYRLRLADFRIMDEPRCRARVSLRESVRLMHRNCINLFKLDLSFWWYFLAELLAAFLCYGDMVLPLLGVSLPMHKDLAFFLFYVLGLAAQVTLLYCVGNRVQTTYALFYTTLADPGQETAPASPVPAEGPFLQS